MDQIEEKYNEAINFINSGYVQKGFTTLCTLSDSGYAPAENLLGECYYYGNGTILNKTAAVKWFEKAAVKGVVQSQYYLGVSYYQGEGVEQNYQVAIDWFKKAAEQGNDKALYYLGECYRYGFGVEINETISNQWYQKAADAGNALALDMLDPQKAKKHDKQIKIANKQTEKKQSFWTKILIKFGVIQPDE